MIDISKLTIEKAHQDLVSGAYSAVNLATVYLARIEKMNPELNVYLEVFSDVLEQAKIADERLKSKQNVTKLTGIPFAIKDNILIKGRRVGAASKILEGYVATYDATVIEKLKDAGVVFLGRVNMDEFAMGGSTENSAYGVTKNPHDVNRVSGGSSGGSAAAVAADLCLAALGSDTGGSIRQPAAFCGVVGLKPTYASVSRSGLMAMGSSLDVIGPITKTAEDSEIVYQVIAGQDPLDSTSIDNVSSVRVKTLTIGIPTEFLKSDGIDVAVRENFEQVVARFKKLGYTIVDVSLPSLQYALATYYVLMPAEVSSNLSRFDGVKYGVRKEGATLLDDYLKTRAEGFGAEARRRIILGTYVLSSGYYDAYYGRACQVRNQISADFKRVFADVDIILTPTTPTPAFKIGEKSSNPLEMYLADIFTVPINLVGVPAMSIPSGTATVDGKKLPLGVQLIGGHGAEATLFSASRQFLGE
jgi:aspartyl-tRNA(Asn)/glutamyl-tRNA(Gln) amidotransferase subunit A